jgi:hypothetical protein
MEELTKELDALRSQVIDIKEDSWQRKVEKFSGRKDGGQIVYEFIDDISCVWKTRSTSEEEKDYLISHLDNPAKEEIQYRVLSSKQNPHKVLNIL